MGEVKSVKVDNWGVFFLQKLQNFFNKTDYCDLTLQFRDNSQLKVHRLVLSACTDYFNVLEQNCEIVDDALIMPNEFQADVVVPIVNFMYTGTLEFELKMYGKLLRTAKEMNMTVLLKLLEAHRRTMENVNRQQRPPSPKGIRRRTVGPAANAGSPQQRVTVQSQPSRVVSNTVVGAATGGAATLRPNTQRATIGNTMIRTTTSNKQEPTSPFEQLRKGYNNNKRPAQTSLLSPPSKKPSLEEVKEFAEQQRMRKQIAAEYGDNDPEYDGGMLYDDVHADDDDDDMPPQPSTSRQNQPATPQKSTQTQLEHGTTTIILKQDSPSQTPTIIVKDSSNAKLNHTKIIAEVLRQYPHIVKGHKNIKLKIMPNNTPTSSPAEKAAASPVKRGATGATATPQSATTPTGPASPHKKLHVSFKADKSTPLITSQQKATTTATQQKATTTAPAQTSAAAAATAAAAPATASSAATASAQKRRIDSKTMHTLIAQGAENTTGPWLCLRCGVNGRPISIPSYRGFRRHLINTHKETIDPALCEHCGWRSGNNRELHFHMYIEHQIKSQLYTFAECALCDQTFLTKPDLEAHINEAHTDENKQQCIYCNKVFDQELQLYKHMKGYHKAQALEDGIIDETDEEYQGSQDEEDEEAEEEQEPEGKVRILSNISLPANSAIAAQRASAEEQQQHQEEEEELEQPQEVKFVGADGNEVELTDEQRKEILSQLNQQQAGAAAGGVVMVLSEPEAEIAKQEGDAKSLAGTEEEYDDSQIYSELGAADSVESGKKSETGTSAADESKESADNLEWAENLIAESEEQNSKEKPEKPRDDISEKLKELTGDWTEDENEDEMMEMEKSASTEIVAKQQPKKTEEAQPVAEESNVVEEPEEEEEDDIDLALKSMHKGNDESTSKTSSAADQPAAASGGEDVVSAEEVPTTSTTTKQDEKMDVDADAAEEEATPAADAAAATTEIKREHDEDEEFIKEGATEADVSMPDAEVDSNSAIAADTEEHLEEVEEDQEHLETDNMRKELLDELIAQAESPEDEDKRSTPLEAIEATEAAATPSATTDSTETDADLVPATQLPASQTEIIEEEAEKPAENNNDGKTTVAAAAAAAAVAVAVAKEAIVEDKPTNSSIVTAAATDKTTTSSVVEVEEAASADKVKSLISEWADDDEDEDENGVSAAAKAEL